MKKISILGSTGSIGTQALDVARHFPNQYTVIGLSAGKNIECLKNQIIEFTPQVVSIQDPQNVKELEDFIAKKGISCAVTSGEAGLNHIASLSVDMLLVAIVGTTSLKPTYTAIQHGNHIALACKEVLVAGGNIIMNEAKKHGINILPVDSEHAALFQCLEGHDISDVDKLILTASGGPFWDKEIDFNSITVEDALKHPNWEMGQKITIDSATMMNKGLEVIEAHHLFDMPYDKIDVILQPKSIIHSLVEFNDGNILAHLGNPDMRLPIQFALSYPEKHLSPWPKTSLADLMDIAFHKPDFEKFPLCKLAFDVGNQGHTYPVVFNAANEAAVSLFLAKKIGFMDIPRVVQDAVNRHTPISSASIEDIIALDVDTKQQTYAHF